MYVVCAHEYTQHTIVNILVKKKITLNYPKSAVVGFFAKGFKNEFETAMVKKLSVFEPLKFYCKYISLFEILRIDCSTEILIVNGVNCLKMCFLACFAILLTEN